MQVRGGMVTSTLIPLLLVLLCAQSVHSDSRSHRSELLREVMKAIDTDPMFPAFHVRPPRNWNNDPNGPMRMPASQGGMAHLWMQYNPDAAVWGNMSWWHTVSPDGLVHWSPIGVSLKNDAPYDEGGVFSGSVTLVQGKPVIFYTCVGPTGQLQCLAFPQNVSDPLLEKWYKAESNPITPQHPVGEIGDNFRDPTTAWIDPATSEWSFAAGLSLQASNSSSSSPLGVASVVLFTHDSVTPNGSAWSRGATVFQDANELSGMFECPDLYDAYNEENDKTATVLKVSCEGLRMDYYRLGTLNTSSNHFHPLHSGAARYDYGTWYASKSFYDEVTNRRILWGWVSEDDNDYAARGWACMQAMPRVVTMHSDGKQLKIVPLPELVTLRNASLSSSRPDATMLLSPSVTAGTSQTTLLDPNPSCRGKDFPSMCFRQEVNASFVFPKTLFNDPKKYSYTRLGLGLGAFGSQFTFVGIEQNATASSTVLNNTAISSQMDYKKLTTLTSSGCADACQGDERCGCWTWNSENSVCALKVVANSVTSDSPGNVSGFPVTTRFVADRRQSGTTGFVTPQEGRTVLDSFNSTHNILQLHVFVDRSIIEGFKDHGLDRIATRVYVPVSKEGYNHTGVDVVYDAQPAPGGDPFIPAVEVLSYDVWSLNSIWTSV